MTQEDGRSSTTAPGTRRFRFAEHPWLSLVTFLFLSFLVLGITGTLVSEGLGFPADSRTAGFINSLTSHVVILFLITPFVLRLPRGKRPFRMK